MQHKNTLVSYVMHTGHHHTQTSKSTLRTGGSFNSRIQADTVWINPSGHFHRKQKPQAIPVLSIVDSTTKFMSARVLRTI